MPYKDPQKEKEHARGRSQTWRLKYPERAIRTRRTEILKKFGLTIEDYERMLAEQNGVCAICHQPETRAIKNKYVKASSVVRRLAVDHDHATQKNRSLLCTRCNQVLGQVLDRPELLIAMAQYLTRWAN